MTRLILGIALFFAILRTIKRMSKKGTTKSDFIFIGILVVAFLFIR